MIVTIAPLPAPSAERTPPAKRGDEIILPPDAKLAAGETQTRTKVEAPGVLTNSAHDRRRESAEGAGRASGGGGGRGRLKMSKRMGLPPANLRLPRKRRRRKRRRRKGRRRTRKTRRWVRGDAAVPY